MQAATACSRAKTRTAVRVVALKLGVLPLSPSRLSSPPLLAVSFLFLTSISIPHRPVSLPHPFPFKKVREYNPGKTFLSGDARM
jgi:hypothetical protein